MILTHFLSLNVNTQLKRYSLVFYLSTRELKKLFSLMEQQGDGNSAASNSTIWTHNGGLSSSNIHLFDADGALAQIHETRFRARAENLIDHNQELTTRLHPGGVVSMPPSIDAFNAMMAEKFRRGFDYKTQK